MSHARTRARILLVQFLPVNVKKSARQREREEKSVSRREKREHHNTGNSAGRKTGLTSVHTCCVHIYALWLVDEQCRNNFSVFDRFFSFFFNVAVVVGTRSYSIDCLFLETHTLIHTFLSFFHFLPRHQQILNLSSPHPTDEDDRRVKQKLSKCQRFHFIQDDCGMCFVFLPFFRLRCVSIRAFNRQFSLSNRLNG